MLHSALAGLALLLSLSTHSPDASVLGVRATTASSAAAVTITGKVLENISGTALVSNNFIHVGRVKVQPVGANVAFTVIYLWQGPGDPDGAPADITAASQVRVRGALALDTDGRPLIVSATIDAIN